MILIIVEILLKTINFKNQKKQRHKSVIKSGYCNKSNVIATKISKKQHATLLR
jgi:hypothetical protein